MKNLDSSIETGSGSSSSAVERQRTSTVRRIAGVLGDAVSVGSDIVTETGKLGMFTVGRIAHGIGEMRRATDKGLSGGSYPAGR